MALTKQFSPVKDIIWMRIWKKQLRLCYIMVAVTLQWAYHLIIQNQLMYLKN